MKNYSPYNGNTDDLTLNSADSIYTEQGGEYSLLNLVQLGSDYSTGFLGSVTFGVEMKDTIDGTSRSTNSLSTLTGTSSTAVVSTQFTSFAEKAQISVMTGAVILLAGVFIRVIL